MGGGLFTAINEVLNLLVSAGNKETEFLIIQIYVGGVNVRIFNGYGPQEGGTNDDILSFWHEVEKQVLLAKG